MDAEWGAFRRELSRDYLKEIHALKVRADGMGAVVRSLRESAEMLKAVDYSRPRVSSSSSGDAMPDAVASIEDAVDRHVQLLAEWASRLAEAEAILSEMEDQEIASILERHYLVGETLEEIAYDLNYTSRAVAYKIAEGCSEMYDKLPPGWRIPMHPAI